MTAWNGARSMMAAGRSRIALVLACGLAVALFAAPSRALAQGCFDIDNMNGSCWCGGPLGSGYDGLAPDPPGQSSLPPVDLFGTRECPIPGPWSLRVTVTWCSTRPLGCSSLTADCDTATNPRVEGIYYSVSGVWHKAMDIHGCNSVNVFLVTLPATADGYWVHTVAAAHIMVEHL